MSVNILFAAPDFRWEEYREALPPALRAAGIEARLARDIQPAMVDYIVYAPGGPVEDFSVFPRARAVLSLWAGVESIVDNETLTQPLTRMVDAGLREGMVEYVTGHVLRYHLGMDSHIVNPMHDWIFDPPPLARQRRVSVLGLGALGAACAQALAALNFDVAGWSCRPREIEGITCLSGDEGFGAALERAEILVLLLPLTAQTEDLIDAEALARLPRGARLINPGRGALIDDDALLDALGSGQLAHATLDVFREEPLPAEHPFWHSEKITVTPHVASETRAETASALIAENIRRSEAGEELLHLVDRDAGY